MTLEKAVSDFLSSYRRGRTAHVYREALQRFFNVFDSSPTLEEVAQLSPEDFRAAIRQLEQTGGRFDPIENKTSPARPATIAQTVSVLRQFFGYLKTLDRSIDDPTAGFKTTPVGDNVPDWNVLHYGETPRLLESITDVRHRAIVTALVLQGWRVSELCRFTWADVRKDKKGLGVEWRGKGNKHHMQRLKPDTLEAIKAIGSERGLKTPLIPTENGEHYTRAQVYVIVTKCSELFGRRVTPHGLRATCISNQISKPGGVERARQWIGHANIDTTQRYSRWQIADYDDDDSGIEDM